MKRSELLAALMPYSVESKPIQHAIEILGKSMGEHIENEDIGDIAERVSVSIDQTFSDDEQHPMWALELELSQLYKRD